MSLSMGSNDAGEEDVAGFHEELLERGPSAPDVSVGAVHWSVQAALEAAFERCGRFWLLAVLFLVFGMFCVLIWSQWIYDAHRDDQCDQPLALLLRFLYITVAINAFQREIIRHLLCYSMHRDGPVEPCRVKFFRRLLMMVALAWPCVGCWMLIKAKHCSKELQLAVRMVTAYYVVVLLIAVLIPAGFVSLMLCLVRHGLVRLPLKHCETAKDLVEALPKVSYNASLFNDTGAPGCFPSVCSICLDSFGEGQPITRVPCGSNGHAFHTDCLEGWLQCARTCPLCRKDLTSSMDPAELEAGVEGAAADGAAP